jgi:hypothetical protein
MLQTWTNRTGMNMLAFNNRTKFRYCSVTMSASQNINANIFFSKPSIFMRYGIDSCILFRAGSDEFDFIKFKN